MTSIGKSLSKSGWEASVTEDGEPWGVYLYGHHDLKLLEGPAVQAEMVAALKWIGLDEFSTDGHDLKIEHLWIHDTAGEDGDPDFSLYFCTANDPGAIAVTGVKF